MKLRKARKILKNEATSKIDRYRNTTFLKAISRVNFQEYFKWFKIVVRTRS